MLVVHFGLTVLVALDAFEDLKIAWKYVTVQTSQPTVGSPLDIKGMIESSVVPPIGAMAAFTRGREAGRLVIRIVGVVVVGAVTGVAIAWRALKLAVLVARVTGRIAVRTCQREDGIVIEDGAVPLVRVVATFTRC